MATATLRHSSPRVVALAILIGALPLAQASMVSGAETPRRGGVLLAAIGADAPSLDPHQEQTFATLQPVAPLYSTLLQIDPYGYPNVIGDVASEWKISPDALTYTFKIRPDIRFHDGSPLTAADVKASYDKILFPPEGVRSIRKEHYSSVASVEAPDPGTVMFKLKFPSASLLTNLASPWNVIFPKKYLDKDPNHFKNNVVGSGPFRFKSYTRGSIVRGRAQPRLLRQGPAVPQRVQVLHQHGDLRARRGDPVRPRLHRVPRPAAWPRWKRSASTSATRSPSSRPRSSSISTSR